MFPIQQVVIVITEVKFATVAELFSGDLSLTMLSRHSSVSRQITGVGISTPRIGKVVKHAGLRSVWQLEWNPGGSEVKWRINVGFNDFSLVLI